MCSNPSKRISLSHLVSSGGCVSCLPANLLHYLDELRIGRNKFNGFNGEDFSGLT